MGYLAVIIGYLVLLVGIGLYLSRKSVKSADDFVVAGRRLPMIILVGTLLASWCGGGGITGSAQFIYQNGPYAGILHFLGAPAGIVVLYFIAGKVREKTSYTIPEIFESKYGTAGRLLATICIVLAYAGIASTQFTAAGKIIAMTTGMDTRVATLIATAVIILLTVSGGMVTVAYTDALGAILMIGGFLIAIPLLFGQAGGMAEAFANLPEGKNSPTAGLSVIQLLGYMLPSFFLIIGDQNMMQRFSSAKNASEARKSNVGLFFAEIAVIGTILLVVTSGIFLIPNAESPDTIIFQLAMGYLPFVIGALLMAACVSFVVTTADSFLLSSATNMTYDVWARFIKKDATDKEKLGFVRIMIVAIGVVAFVLGIYFPSILSLQMYSYTMYGAAITPALVCALFYKKVTRAGGVSGIVAGAALTILWDAVLSSPMGIQSAIISVPVAFLVIFIVSAFTQKGQSAAKA